MDAIIDRGDAPRHLFNIPELDFSEDVFAERVSGPWFRLAAWSLDPYRDERGVETVVERKSVLIPSNTFADIFDQLNSVGNVIDNLGKPGGTVLWVGEKSEYRYFPFHRFEFLFTSAVGEPLVFANFAIAGVQLFINPDIWLFFGLEEKTPGNGIWWDPRRGVDALCRRVVDQGHLTTVEIRIEYLRKYLQARQMSLLVAHYRHLHLFDPSQETIGLFVNGDVMLGSPELGAKATFQNLRKMGSGNCNKVLTGYPGYVTRSPWLEDQEFIFPVPSTMQLPEETKGKIYSWQKRILKPTSLTFQNTNRNIHSMFTRLH